MEITITIKDADKLRVLEALVARFGYLPGDETIIKSHLVGLLKGITKNHEISTVSALAAEEQRKTPDVGIT